ncbi:MAG: hypothetical protein IJ040_03420 [Lachnospiraceae bacterium]|nr:hypothetical protein [Lachnospiraceae bacterium]
MATIFTILAYGGLALAVICLIIAAVFFFLWDIPKILGNITGRNEKKSIERIRKEGYEANASKKTSIKTAEDTGKIQVRLTETDELSENKPPVISRTSLGRAQQSTQKPVENMQPEGDETWLETAVLSGQELEEETSVLAATQESADEEETSVLAGGQDSEAETSVLAATQTNATEEETSVLVATQVSVAEEETSVLAGGQDSEEETSVLAGTQEKDDIIRLPDVVLTKPGTVTSVLDLIIVHTDDEVS